MTSQELVEQAIRKMAIAPTPEERLSLQTAIHTQIPNALKTVSHRVAKDQGYEGLQKDFSVTPTAGVVDLTALAGIIFDIARSRVRITSSNLPIRAIDSMETLISGGLQIDQVLYAQDGTDLRFRDTAGALGTYATAVKIKANYILTLTDVPTQYEAMLVETVVGLLGDLVSEKRAREMSADTRA